MKRITILTLSVLLFCNTASHSNAAQPQPGTKNEEPGTAATRPNVLFIAVDDLASSLGC